MTPRPMIATPLALPAPLKHSPSRGLWGEREGLKGQALAGLAVNCEGGGRVLGRLGEALGRPNRGPGEGASVYLSIKPRVYSVFYYIGEFGEGI